MVASSIITLPPTIASPRWATHRATQVSNYYSRELLFSTVVELVTLVSLGLRPSLHAAARTMDTLPVTLAGSGSV